MAIAQRTYSYEGIPLRGSQAKFVESLKSHGFKVTETETIGLKDYSIRGNYFGEECDMILISAKGAIDDVAGITVITPKQDTWENTLKEYKKFKKLFIEFYGKPFIQEPSSTSSSLPAIQS